MSYVPPTYLQDDKEARVRREFLFNGNVQAANKAGVIVPGGIIEQAFQQAFGEYAWTWGGDWSSVTDYMHYSFNHW